MSNQQRAALNVEATALQREWNRIVESTTFNGVQLLTGANTRSVLQGGYGGATSLAVQIGEGQLSGALDGAAGETTRVSVDSSNNQVNALSQFIRMTPDARYLVFYSDATNLVSNDTNGVGDIFLRDRATGTTTLVSTSEVPPRLVAGES